VEVDGGWGPTGLQVEAFSWGEIVGLWCMGLACLKGSGWQSGNPACLWNPGLTGLGGVAQQNGDHVCVGPWFGKLEGHRLVVWILCRAVQALGVWLGGIVNVCGSLALRACPMEILCFWGVGLWGSTALALYGVAAPRAYGAGLSVQHLLFF
jgi:hypothetical protein